MCRNIRTLFNFEPPASREEIHDASLQFVRKLTGFQRPSKNNEQAFNRAVGQIDRAVAQLLGSLETRVAPKNRAALAADKSRPFYRPG